MKKLYFVLSFIFLSQLLFAQRGKDGAKTVSATVVVNEYTALTANASTGNTSITVANSALNANGRFASNLAAGDLVMIIQMQGASILTGVKDSTYGTITSYNNCGLYEFREVLSVPNATTINLTCPLVNNYTSTGSVQVVRIPRYSSLTVNGGGIINCDPWNGQTGGVLSVEVLGATTINGSIDASTFGFRGGVAVNTAVPGGVSVFYTLSNDSGAQKGEGIAGYQASYNVFGGGYGRGAAANAGGGGNSHNAGGGGGGNGGNIGGYNSNGNPDVSTASWANAWNLEYPGFATNVSSGGGKGGYVWAKCGPNPLTTAPGDPAWGGDNRYNHGGKGGRPLDYSTGRLFMGGGGGSGHEDNGVGSSGSAGGGLIYLMCYGTVSGTGNVLSNGKVAPDANDGGVFTPEDGAGGAGAGGTIIINAVGAISGISATANGGKGGNQITGNNFQSECEGPGGGGSGGYIGLSSVGITTSVLGGANGTTDASCMTAFIPNGATIGGVGTVSTITNFVLSSANAHVCPGSSATLTATLTGSVPAGTLTWYDSTGVNVLGTGASYTTPAITKTTIYMVGYCPGDYKFPDTVFVGLTNNLSIRGHNAACGGTGSAVAVITGASGPFTYLWSPGGYTTDSISGLSAGVYTVTVTSGSCSTKDSVTIIQPASIRDSIVSSTNIKCFGNNNGSAIVGAKGGTGTFTYSWSNGETSAKDSLLSAGSYTVTVKDGNGCTGTASVTITQPPSALRDSIASSVNVLCYGNSTGSATVGVKGGTPAYTFSWTNAQTTQTATALAAGTYTVIVKDANGCKDSANVTITQPTALKLTAAAFAATCNGTCDGSANVIPANGTPPYKYLWSNSVTTANLTNLCAGTYSVVVTDANGCVHDTNPLTVTQPTAITMTTNSTSAFCNQPNGSASMSASGGTPPYTYLWSNGATTTSITNVKPGTYCVGVTDANKCKDTVCVVVPNTPGEKASIASVVNVTCNGGSNGIATGSAAGGTAPYTYTWNTSPVQTTQVATNLAAGVYVLTVTDATGCPDTAIATITQPAPINITVTGNAQLCIGQHDTLKATATGGNGGYTFTWNGTTVGSTYTVNPIATTSYTVVATDSKGCNSAATIVPVRVRDSIHVALSPGATMCSGDTATLSATASGGDSVFTYSWAPGGQTGSSIKVSPTSTTSYTVTVKDGCNTPAVQKIIVVNLFPSRPISFTADSVTGCQAVCINFTDSVIGVVKTITWNFGDGGTANISNPRHCYTAPGIYNVSLTVTNDSGCVVSKTIPNMITVYSDPVPNFTWSPQSLTSLFSTVAFTDQSTDVYGITNWMWAFGGTADSTSLKQNPSYTYPDSGWYCPKLTVTNKHGCKDSISHCIYVTPQFTIYIPNAFTPNSDGLNDIFLPKGDYIESFEMFIFDRWGQQIFHSTNIRNGWDGTIRGRRVQEDTYVYLINVTDPLGKTYNYLGKVSVVR